MQRVGLREQSTIAFLLTFDLLAGNAGHDFAVDGHAVDAAVGIDADDARRVLAGIAVSASRGFFTGTLGLTRKVAVARRKTRLVDGIDGIDRRRLTVHNQIVQDVRTAYARYRQARVELDLVRGKTRPEVEAAIRQAEGAFKEGHATYLIVLESNRQLITTLAREAQLMADLRRAWAELERAVGRRLVAPTRPETPER